MSPRVGDRVVYMRRRNLGRVNAVLDGRFEVATENGLVWLSKEVVISREGDLVLVYQPAGVDGLLFGDMAVGDVLGAVTGSTVVVLKQRDGVWHLGAEDERGIPLPSFAAAVEIVDTWLRVAGNGATVVWIDESGERRVLA